MANIRPDLSHITPAEWIGGPILLAWSAYLLIAPTIGFDWIESWHNEQRAVQIILLTCTAAAYCLIGLLERSQASADRWYFPYLFLAFIALGLFSATHAKFVHAALAEIGMFILLAVVVMLTARIVVTDVDRYVRYARWFALLFATAYVLGVATRYLAAINLERTIDLDVLILGYANPRFPSALHAILIPLLTLTIIKKTELRSMRAGAAIVLSLIWTINLGLGTRGIWFAYALAVPITVLLLGWRPTARPLAIVALSAIAGAGLYFVFFFVVPTLVGSAAAVAAPTDNLTTVTSREILWQLSWEAIKTSPWLGIGPMQFATLGSRVGAHPHNWPLQLAAEWGVPALCLATFAVLKLCMSIRATQTVGPGVALITLAVAVGLALGFVDGNLVMPVSQIGLTLVLGLLVGALRVGQHKTKRSWISDGLVVATALFAVVASSVVIAFATSTLPEQSISVESFRRLQPGAWVVPRFWEQGLLF